MRNVKINYILPTLGLLLLPSLAPVTSACSCMGVSPCEAYAGASVVFVGRVTQTGVKSIARSFPANAMSTTLVNGDVTSAQFRVEEAFLGVRLGRIDISGEDTTCDFPFKSGERYLVYGYQNDKTGTFHTNICSGTAELAERNDDLAYLRRVAKQPPGGALFGEIMREVRKPNGPAAVAMTKTEIILENGKQQFKGLSDEFGKFELRAIKAGRYRVHTNPATNYSGIEPLAEEPRKEWELEIPTHGCVQAWFVCASPSE